MFFDIFCSLCETKGVSCKKAATEIGLSNSITTKWKKTGATPSGDTLAKIAEYFGVTADYLLHAETKKDPLAIQTEGISGLSPEELNLILKYRAASEERKESARLLLRME